MDGAQGEVWGEVGREGGRKEGRKEKATLMSMKIIERFLIHALWWGKTVPVHT